MISRVLVVIWLVSATTSLFIIYDRKTYEAILGDSWLNFVYIIGAFILGPFSIWPVWKSRHNIRKSLEKGDNM